MEAERAYANECLEEQARYYQKVSKDYADDAMFYIEHGVISPAKRAQIMAAAYAQASLAALRALLAD